MPYDNPKTPEMCAYGNCRQPRLSLSQECEKHQGLMASTRQARRDRLKKRIPFYQDNI